MGRKTFIATIIGISALLIAAVAAYAFDSSRESTISEGVRIAGVQLGGLEADEARIVIRQNVVNPYSRDVKVKAGGKVFNLNADKLGVRADIDGMVDEALRVSRDGNLLSRVWREVTGGEVSHQVQPRLEFEHDSVEKFVDQIAAVVDQAPVNASVEPSAGSLTPVASIEGTDLRQEVLKDQILEYLQNPGQSGPIKAEVEKIEPEVTTDSLASQYPTYIVVDRGSFQLHFYENLELTKSYTVAIGAAGYDTPTGLYHIQDKAVDPTWNVPDSDWAGDLAGTVVPPGPDNPLKARWMGIYNGAGIHGTSDTGSLGSAASHGCIRMSVFDVTELYDQVPTGTPIYIG